MRFYFMLVILLLPIIVNAEPLDQVVAVVNDSVITETELEAQLDVMKQQMQAKTEQMPSEQALRKQVLDHLIEVNLQLQLAKNNDIQVDTVELDETIAKIAADNKLTLTQLREELNKQGIGWDDYRENIRKEMLMVRMQQQAVGRDIQVSAQQVEDYLKTAKRSEKNQYSYHVISLVVPLADEPTSDQLKRAESKAKLVFAKLKPTDDFNQVALKESNSQYTLEANDLGERHLAELPDLFSNQIINMKIGDIVGPIRAGNGFHVIKLIAINQHHEPHYVTKSHVRHILLKQDANLTEADALRQANNLYQQLKSGKNFAQIAKQHSLDAASAVKGGDLGWVMEEDLVPEFAEAVNTLPLNTISHPVKSKFGWHLIEVLARETVDDSVGYQRQQVRKFLQQRKFTEAVQNWKQHIRADAYVQITDKSLA
jgi:peptidyl-prolyl cis-trans isomerase SurA